MSSRNNNNNKKEVFKELEKTISPVLIVNNHSLKPYIELFEYYPENIYQQSLGSLVGFFEIKEYSEDSAYIVNFLTSVLKKEYYINPKRAVAESLDSALHKVNLALSEIAKQGNVEWLGNLNAAICVLEKNNAHFSVSGKAKIFLYRNTMLTDISEGLASDSPEPHPLKTFTNVSSGRLEKEDQMLITSEDIFHILPVMEIKKNFQRFKGEKLVQFLKTALSNQLELIASIVVQMSEAKPTIEVTNFSARKKSPAVANVFSEKTFAKESAQLGIIKNESETNGNETVNDYIDEKTGHIYVQGEINKSDESTTANLYWDIFKEKTAQKWYAAKNEIKHKFSVYKKQLAKKRELRKIEKEKEKRALEEKLKREQAEKSIADMRQHELEVQVAEKKKQEQDLKMVTSEEQQLPKETSEIAKESFVIPEKKELSFREKLEIARKQQQKEIDVNESFSLQNEPVTEGKNIQISDIAPFFKKNGQKFTYIAKRTYEKLFASVQKITEVKNYSRTKNTAREGYSLAPHFSKIKSSFFSLSLSQKVYALAALILIFIVPFFITRWMNKPQAPTITQIETIQPTLSEILANEKNIDFSAKKQSALLNDNLINALATKNGIAAITKNSIFVINKGEQKEYALPENSGTVIKATFMKDLSLVFIFTDQNKVISFHPISTKFTSDSINLPANISKDFIGTYMTYLYILDPRDNQIYRYPRATGGFGNKTDWLKEEISLEEVSDMTIDDNIYCIQNNSVLKLFKGKKQDFSLENSNTPVNFDKIFTDKDSPSLYALDTKNSRIIQYNKTDGTIIKQYFNEALTDSTSLSVDEQNKVAYISTSSELISISIQ